jgi:hypothetical protein
MVFSFAYDAVCLQQQQGICIYLVTFTKRIAAAGCRSPRCCDAVSIRYVLLLLLLLVPLIVAVVAAAAAAAAARVA